jgi:hypothetical protein
MAAMTRSFRPEKPVHRFRELRRRREVDEPIGLVDRRPLESPGLECGPFIGGEYLVRNLVGFRVSNHSMRSATGFYRQRSP